MSKRKSKTMAYIYKITNLINGKVYIGKTSEKTIEERFKIHIKDSKKEHCEKRPLYDAMNKYGIENFIIEEVESGLTDEEACIREEYWIKQYNSYIGFENCNGYNATLGGDGKRLYNYKEIAQKYQELKSVKDTAKYFNCDKKVIRLACNENNLSILDNKPRKQLKRIDIKTGEIKYYSCITEASQDIPGKQPETARKNISRAINRGSSGYGYYWEVITS